MTDEKGKALNAQQPSLERAHRRISVPKHESVSGRSEALGDMKGVSLGEQHKGGCVHDNHLWSNRAGINQ